MDKPISRHNQAINTKLKITEKAMELLRTKPYDTVKVSDVCEAANVSVGSFYHHFEHKGMLIINCYNLIDELILENYLKKSHANFLSSTLELNISAATIITQLGYNFICNGYRQLLIDDSQYTFSAERLFHQKLSDLLILADQNNELIKTDLALLSEHINRTARGNIFDWCIKGGTTDLIATWTSDIQSILTMAKKEEKDR